MSLELVNYTRMQENQMNIGNHKSPVDPQYHIDKFGSLMLRRSGGDHHHGNEDLAILFTTDDMPMLLKHGPAAGIAAHREKLSSVMTDITTIVVPLDALRSEKGPAILEEINACLAISGRVGVLEQRLTALQA